MPSFETKNFGSLSYESDSVLEFPAGLPGFEKHRYFLALRFPDSEPLIFLQSLEDAGLCFITMPVLVVDPHYRLQVCGEDRDLVGLPLGRPLELGKDILCLTVLAIRENGPTANLLAPVVVNLSNRKAVQAVAADSSYPLQHVLLPEEVPVC